MKFEGRHLIYVDHRYRVYPALGVYSRDAEEFGEQGPPRMTIAYFPEEHRAELLRGNVAAALKVVYDVQHGDHPDHAPHLETITVHAGLSQSRSVTPSGVHAGLPTPVVAREPTGYLIKPGNFYLDPGGTMPAERVAVEPQASPVAEEPLPEPPPEGQPQPPTEPEEPGEPGEVKPFLVH